MTIPSPEALSTMAKASPDAVTEWEAAFHEAGHAIVAMDFGTAPDLVYLNDDPNDRSHAGRNVSSGHTPVYQMVQSGIPPHDPGLLEMAGRQAAVLFAGSFAEMRALGRAVNIIDEVVEVVEFDAEDPEARTDVAELAAAIRCLDVDNESWLEGAAEVAEEILERRWSDVERLAEMLTDGRSVDRELLWDEFELGRPR